MIDDTGAGCEETIAAIEIDDDVLDESRLARCDLEARVLRSGCCEKLEAHPSAAGAVEREARPRRVEDGQSVPRRAGGALGSVLERS